MSFNNISIDTSWTLFLDRDGVINRYLSGDYVKKVDEFEFLPGSVDAIARLSSIFGRIFVLTNQRGIGRGLMTHTDLKMIHDHMVAAIEAKGGRLDKIYYCAHDLVDNCDCRKPGTGMAIQAQKDFPAIDFKRSVIVGDSVKDIELGQRLGMKTIRVENPALADEKPSRNPDYECRDLQAFAFWVIDGPA